MHTEDPSIPDPDIPFVDLNLPFVELDLEDTPDMDEVLKTSPRVAISQPLTASQTTFSQRISIRIPRSVLATTRKKAAALGMPYQTYINLILAQHATG